MRPQGVTHGKRSHPFNPCPPDREIGVLKEEIPLPGHFSRAKPVKWIVFVVIS
jgi:hypothetical protein